MVLGMKNDKDDLFSLKRYTTNLVWAWCRYCIHRYLPPPISITYLTHNKVCSSEPAVRFVEYPGSKRPQNCPEIRIRCGLCGTWRC